MSLWSQSRLIDILTHIDMSLIDDELPEGDLDNSDLFSESRSRWNRRRVAVVSGVAAAGSIALTGAVVLVCRKYSPARKAG